MTFNKKFHKVSEIQSPQPALSKQGESGLKVKKGRVLMGGLGDSYLSFYKIENEKQQKNVKGSTDLNSSTMKEPIVEKSQMFENLQETIMKQTTKNNERIRSFQEKMSTEYKIEDIEQFINRLTRICIEISKQNKEHKKEILQVLHKFNQFERKDRQLKSFLILTWILHWFQPILKMMHKIITKKSVNS